MKKMGGLMRTPKEILDIFGHKCIKNAERYTHKLIDNMRFTELCEYHRDQALQDLSDYYASKEGEIK